MTEISAENTHSPQNVDDAPRIHEALLHHRLPLMFGIISFAVFLAVGIGVYAYLQLTGSIAQSCSHNGQTYQAGETFESGDECNSCFCGVDGEVACTLRACVTPTPMPSPMPAYTSKVDETGELITYTVRGFGDTFEFTTDKTWTISKNNGYNTFSIHKEENSLTFCYRCGRGAGQSTRWEMYTFAGDQTNKIIYADEEGRIYSFAIQEVNSIIPEALIDIDSENHQSILEELDQILSTFRFLDEGEKECIIDGVTYQDGESYLAGDGCNICYCNGGCTEMACNIY